MIPINCWEYKQCRRHPGGYLSLQQGVCPASTEEEFNGVNHGINGGRICWAISGSFRESEPTCQILENIDNCIECDFFVKVNRCEGISGMFVFHPKELDRTPNAIIEDSFWEIGSSFYSKVFFDE